MDSRQTLGPGRGGFGGGLTGPVPKDIWILLGIILFSFSLNFFASTAAFAAALRLTPAVWQRGFVWQPLTYSFVGTGAPGIWFVIELLILFMFGRDVFYRLGRRLFWGLLAGTAAAAALVALVAQGIGLLATGGIPATAFALMQGQHMLLIILVAAFATLNAEATIYLFFVLPVQARWFLGLEILFAFLGFLGTRDLAGFLGCSAAVGFTWAALRRGQTRQALKEGWLRLQAAWIRARLGWLKRRRGLRVVRGDKKDPGPWVH